MDEEMIKNIKNNNIPSDLMARAKKIINTPAGREMIKEMGEKGITKEMIEQLMIPKVETVKVLLIRPNGIVKTRMMASTDECPSLLHATTPTKYIKEQYTVWYDANIKTINRKASKWLGFNVGGVIIIMGNDLDIF